MADKSGANEAGLGCLVLFVMVGLMLYYVYGWIDSVGWIPHYEDSVITAQTNWFVGESKDCLSYPLDGQIAGNLKKATGYALSRIQCDDGPEHSINIRFYGRKEQPEYVWITWRCTRNTSSFICKQTGNSPEIKRGHDQATGRPVISYDGGKTWQWADQK